MKVTEKDLIGQLKGFPIAVVEKMLANQVAQGNREDISVFQRKKDASKWQGGFIWVQSPEGKTAWSRAFNFGDFSYLLPDEDVCVDGGNTDEPISEWVEDPKFGLPSIGDKIKVSSDDSVKKPIRVFLAYVEGASKPILTVTEEVWNDLLNGPTNTKSITVTPWQNWEPVLEYVELTLEDISKGKGMGVDPNLIKIKQ